MLCVCRSGCQGDSAHLQLLLLLQPPPLLSTVPATRPPTRLPARDLEWKTRINRRQGFLSLTRMSCVFLHDIPSAHWLLLCCSPRDVGRRRLSSRRSSGPRRQQRLLFRSEGEDGKSSDRHVETDRQASGQVSGKGFSLHPSPSLPPFASSSTSRPPSSVLHLLHRLRLLKRSGDIAAAAAAAV